MFQTRLSASVDLVLNLTLLISLSILSGFLEKRLKKESLSRTLLQGLLFGLTAIIGMTRPFTLGPGIQFDGRSVMISLCALYFGAPAAAAAVVLTMAYRILLGGSGTLMGILVILSSALIGLFARHRLKPNEKPPTPLRLFEFGLVVHVVMLALIGTLPAPSILSTLLSIGPPILLLYPLATILAGKILSDQVSAQKIFDALHKSEERFKLSMEASSDGLWDLNVATDDSYYNPAYYRILGYEPGAFPAKGSAWRQRVHSDDRLSAEEANRACILDGKDYLEIEFRMRAKNGDWRWIFSRGKCISRDARGVATRLVGTHVDITERKRIEEQLKTNIREKEILLSEVHHRVKNNLSIISSLLNLQSTMIKSPEQAINAFQNARDRISAMALVHEELYNSPNITKVNMNDYVGRLVSQLSLAYGKEHRVQLNVDVQDAVLSVDTSIPCGLILNELITNAYKYAFPDGRIGAINIRLRIRKDGYAELEVADDGVGMPSEMDIGRADSLGLTLVRLLIEQLNGTLDTRAAEGTRFLMRFPVAQND